MRYRQLMTCVAATALSGCVAMTSSAPPAAQAEIIRTLEEATEPAPVTTPAAVTEALLPRVLLPSTVGALGEERFDVNVTDNDARSFFMGLVEGTPYNMVVHPEVSGRLSLTLKNVTVPEVIEAVREVYGYDFRETSAGFVALPATFQTRIFQINYLNFTRSGISRTRVTSGQISEGNGSGEESQQGQYAGAGSVFSQGGKKREGLVTGSRIDTTHESDFWSELERTLLAIVGASDGRRVIVNAQTGVLVVRAMPGELRDVERYLQQVQATAQRQVVLEAKIIEVALNDGFQAGINWATVAIRENGDNFFGGLRTPQGPLPDDPADADREPITVRPGTITTGFETMSLGGAFALAIDMTDFNAFVELLKIQGDTRVLSSPRVSTLNNQKAVIKSGTDEFFVTDISSNTVTGTSSSTNRDVELTPFFSGIALDVTPQISEFDEVILHIHPTVSEVTDQVKDLTIAGETDSIPLAFSQVRESDSIVKAKSGQIIVIGGLMRTARKQQIFGTPVLSDIPGIGRLFRSQREVETKTELVILLKAIVVNDDDAWAEMLQGPLERVRTAKHPSVFGG